MDRRTKKFEKPWPILCVFWYIGDSVAQPGGYVDEIEIATCSTAKSGIHTRNQRTRTANIWKKPQLPWWVQSFLSSK